ncbi:SDR family NAD(P)-dependent oxidoreductase [Pimelobacter simplex]|uniref:SDR family NAD(P)-dependent oxidoreductase n=1 Tax=Nocardioides simplex TaxID=2045 RepID=UPI00214FA2AF|nr:SDR family oxidoreductase [Pimelobacter simplex]UUW91134.1 SDR family oxidoreductase [Pimelobacter simplex]UUW94962.1 SDR family oxidoreductase [Pimelobacter simplex]
MMPCPLAVVTGAAGDVGAATAARLHADGWRVLLADVDLPAAQERADELGEHAEAAYVDLADDASVRALAERAAAQSPAALVSCAGVASVGRFVDDVPGTWELLHRVNLHGPMLLTQALLPALAGAAHPRIVYVASDSARAGAAHEAAYAASKAGLLGLAKSLAREHARDGITVNVVCPGPVRGRMVDEHMAGKQAMLDKLVAAIPSRRLAEPDDVAAAIAWLSSPDAAYVTGQTLSVSGGLTMH